MDKNQGYSILKVVMLGNGRGFALGEHPAAPRPFVTWACYDDEHGKRQYEGGATAATGRAGAGPFGPGAGLPTAVFFVVSHADRPRHHVHIYYKSTTLDCTRKYRDFLGSARALRRLSDRICLEHDLSAIKNPKLHSKGQFRNYGQWLGGARPTRFRASTLGDGYGPEDVEAVIDGQAPVRKPAQARPRPAVPRSVNLIIDIQQRTAWGKGPGYERWAKIYNLKQMAAALQFLQENGLTDYDALAERTAAVAGKANVDHLLGLFGGRENMVQERQRLRPQTGKPLDTVSRGFWWVCGATPASVFAEQKSQVY